MAIDRNKLRAAAEKALEKERAQQKGNELRQRIKAAANAAAERERNNSLPSVASKPNMSAFNAGKGPERAVENTNKSALIHNFGIERTEDGKMQVMSPVKASLTTTGSPLVAPAVYKQVQENNNKRTELEKRAEAGFTTQAEVDAFNKEVDEFNKNNAAAHETAIRYVALPATPAQVKKQEFDELKNKAPFERWQGQARDLKNSVMFPGVDKETRDTYAKYTKELPGLQTAADEAANKKQTADSNYEAIKQQQISASDVYHSWESANINNPRKGRNPYKAEYDRLTSELKLAEQAKNNANNAFISANNALKTARAYIAYTELQRDYNVYKMKADNNNSGVDYAKLSGEFIGPGVTGDEISYNGSSDFLNKYTDTYSTSVDSAVKDLNKYGTEEQKNIFLYLYTEKGSKAASDYAKDINPLVAEQAYEATKNDYTDSGNLGRFGMGVGNSFMGGLSGDFVYNMESVGRAILGDTSYHFQNTAQRKADAVSDAETNGVAKVGMAAVRTTGAQTPMIVLGLATGGLTSGMSATSGLAKVGVTAVKNAPKALFFASSFGGSYSDAINSGNSYMEALGYGTVSALLETLSESLSGGLDYMGGAAAKNATKVTKWLSGTTAGKIAKEAFSSLSISPRGKAAFKLAGHLVANGFGEGLEEAFTAALEPMVRNAMLHEDNELFTKEHWEEIGYSALLGAVSSFIMNSPYAPSAYSEGYSNALVSTVLHGKATNKHIDAMLKDGEALRTFEQFTGIKLDNNRVVAGTQIIAFSDAVAKNKAVQKDGKATGVFDGVQGANLSEIVQNAGENVTEPSAEQVKAETEAVEKMVQRVDAEIEAGETASDNSVEEKLEDTSSIELEKDVEEYPYNMQTVLKEYTESVDDRIIELSETPKGEFKRENLDLLSDRAVKDVSKIVGFDVKGYRLAITSSTLEHIENRHGEHGEQDNSMSNIEDVARIPYVVNNYDNVELLTEENGDVALSGTFRNKDNSLAKMVRMSKKINGTYYVVEAVPDSSYKKMWVVSAYISKEGITQVSDAVNTAPDSESSETPLASLPSNNNISQPTRNVNTENDVDELDRVAEQIENDNTPVNKPWIRYPNPDGTITAPTNYDLITPEKTVSSGIAAGATREDAEAAGRLSDILGVRMLFYYNAEENGMMDDGFYEHENEVLYINAASAKPIAQIVAHEITHSIEKTDAYWEIVRIIAGIINRDHRNSMYVRGEAKKAFYAKRGIELDDAGAYAEVIADYIEKELLTNEQAIKDIVAERRGAGKVILAVVEKILRKAKKENPEGLYLQKIQRLFKIALDETKAKAENKNVNRKAEADYRTTLENDEYIQDIAGKLRSGQITEEEYLRAYNEYVDSNEELRSLENGDGVQGRQYSFSEVKFSKQLDDWLEGKGKKYGSYNGIYFELGTTPDILKKHGAPAANVIMLEKCLLKITGGKHAISLEELKKLPTQLNDPILLFKSSYVDKKGKRQKAFVALTEMVDIHENDVIAVVHINKHQDRMVVNKIASVYSKSDEITFENKIVPYVNSQINSGNLIDGNIEKASTWFTSRGLQLPKLVQTIIDASEDSIYQKSKIVNTSGKRSYSFSKTENYQDDDMLYDSSFADKYDPYKSERNKQIRKEREQRKAERKADEYDSRGLAGAAWWNRNRNKADRMFNKSELERISKISSDLEGKDELTAEQAISLWGEMRKLGRNVTAISIAHQITNEELVQVTDLLRGDRTIEDVENLNPDRYNIDGIIAVAKAKMEYEVVAKQLQEFRARHKAKLYNEADHLIKVAMPEGLDDKVHVLIDKTGFGAGFRYRRETMERNIRDIVKDPALAEEIINTYFAPVHHNEAERNRTKEQYRDRIKKLNIAQKAHKGDTYSEAHAVQLYGEVSDIIDTIMESKGRIKERDGKTLDEWIAIEKSIWEDNPNLDKERIKNIVGEFRKIYDELFSKMNEVRVLNGYEPVRYRRGYFPHFTEGVGDSIFAKICHGLGINAEVTELPTTINGLTHTFKPGIRWMSNALERLGFATEYDALKGFDKYLEAASDVIHHTDDIQRLRAFATRLRYNASKPGLKAQADAYNAREDLTQEDKDELISNLYKNGQYTGSNFVAALDEYTNVLAGKKSIGDREFEYMMGRKMYNIVKAVEGRVASNMIAANIASAMTNFIPMTQALSVLKPRYMIRGLWETGRSIIGEGDNLQNVSDFLVNRRGSDLLVTSKLDKISKKLGTPMEFIDSISSGTIVRARYYENLARGLSESAAMDEANSFTAGLMADRSKGSMPTLFEQRNPIMKLFTQFQLEVNNQLSFVGKDLPMYHRDKLGIVLAWTLVKFMLWAYLFNDLYEKLVGRRPALDPLSMINDFAGDITGKKIDNFVDILDSIIAGEPEFLEDVKNPSMKKAVEGLGKNVAEELPFVGGMMGGGRIPISSALPDVGNIINTAMSEQPGKKKAYGIGKELAKPIYYGAFPAAGGAVKKAVEGAYSVAKGGSYSVDKNGERQLQYPVYNDTPGAVAGNLAKSMLFGKTSTETGREWVENDFESFGAKYTRAYDESRELDGVSQKQAYEFLDGLRNVKDDGPGGDSEDSLKRKYIADADISEDAKEAAYMNVLVSDNEEDKQKEIERLKAVKASGLGFNDYLEARNYKYELDNTEGMSGAARATAFAKWADDSFSTKQSKVMKEVFTFSSGFKAEAEKYEKFRAAGLSSDEAYKMCSVLDKLEPEDGKSGVSDRQKARAVIDSDISEKQQLKALSEVVSDSEYKKVKACYNNGISLKQYYDVKDEVDRITSLLTDEQKEKYGEQERVRKAIENIGGAVTGTKDGKPVIGPKYRFSEQDKAILWQAFDSKWSSNKNPFSRKVGAAFKKLMGWE